jgi:hypothetical protein
MTPTPRLLETTCAQEQAAVGKIPLARISAALRDLLIREPQTLFQFTRRSAMFFCPGITCDRYDDAAVSARLGG